MSRGPGIANCPRLSRGEMSPRSGCQSKLPPCDLQELLEGAAGILLARNSGSTLTMTPEDCAVLETGQGQILATTDIAPLVGVDLWYAGCIAALHAMSDIYACGGVPRWAIATLIVDPDQPRAYMETVLAGLVQACHDEGAALVGGHTSLGRESMVGLTVLGTPRSTIILRKGGAAPGDQLFISKPLGVGMIVKAYKLGLVGDRQLSSAIEIMTKSNGPASACAVDARVHASTDVTGFGLLGHLAELLGPKLGASLVLNAIPIIPAAASLPPEFGFTDWAKGNLDYARHSHQLVGVMETEPHRLAPLLDPQTNGGLLVAADLTAARSLDGFSRIGEVTTFPTISVS